MGEVNICLKRSFIAVASVVAIINAILLVLILFVHIFFPEGKEFASELQGINYMYIMTIIPLVLFIFGLVGVCKKMKWAVIVFTVGMILMSLILFFLAVVGLSSQSEISDEVKQEYLDMGPLSETSEGFQEHMSEQQTNFKCCGLAHGYMDWGDEIPLSCKCVGDPVTNPCVEVLTEDNKSFMVYEEPCLPYLMDEYNQSTAMVIGVMLTLAVLWVLVVVLSIIILCKLFETDHSPAVVYHAGIN